MAMAFWRTPLAIAVIAGALAFALTGMRLATWDALLPLFEWMETTLFGRIGKTWGAAFAVVEAFHLLGMALLGGAVLLCDARLLGLAFRDIPIPSVWQQTHRLFVVAVILVIATGVFMACAVALKIYYLEVFWYKMLALSAGILFVFFIKRPLLSDPARVPDRGLCAALAIASLMLWFTVAATGRWIGFSG
jgi:hypothetical protein